jgi:GNAT superfamily N-acetyltransferase
MGLTIQPECWSDFWPSMRPIWENEHRVEVHPKEVINGRINDAAYSLWEEMGLLDIITARLDTLVGYFVAVTMPYVNFTDVLCGMVTLYYVRKQYRNLGIGTKLINYIEDYLKRQRNVDCIILNTKIDLPFGPMFDKLGYKPHETLRMKWI